MGERSFEDLELDAALITGGQRCVSRLKTGTSAVAPHMSFQGQERDLCAMQRETYDQPTLDIYQVELLKRAKRLLDFWDANVGGTADFPLILTGDSQAAIDLLNSQMRQLQAAVGLLSEV